MLIDPPWTFDRTMLGRNPPYPCLSFEQLKLLPLKEIADPEGSIILMWTIGSHMNLAIDLLKSWSFSYVNIFLVWKKVTKDYNERLGLGRYSRGVYEFLLLATKGRVGNFRREMKGDNLIS